MPAGGRERHGCHYSNRGYERLGGYMFGLLARDLHGRNTAADVAAPDVAAAWFSAKDRTEITLATRARDEVLRFEAGAEAGFWVEGCPDVKAVGGRTAGNRIVLTLSAPASGALAVC